MIVPYKKENIKIIPYKNGEKLNEEYENICTLILNESLGAFENQYSICKEIAPIILDMYKTHNASNVVKLEIKCPIKEVHINVNKDIPKGTMIMYTYGNINRINNELGIIGVNIFIPQSFAITKDDEFILKEIENCIAHEFMHGNIFLKRLDNNLEVLDAPQEYETYLTIIRETDNNSILYKYAYGMYSTYYQEMQAIISQSSVQLRNILNKPNASNDEIKEALKQTEAYQIYTQNAYDLGAYLESTKDDDIIWEYLSNELLKYGININTKTLEKNIKKIINRSNVAIFKIMKNAMHYLMN